MALGSLVLTGPLKLPVFAAFSELIHPLRTPSDLLGLPAVAASTGVLTIGAWTLSRTALRQILALRTAHARADSSRTAGDLCVIDSPHPDAYALPGRLSRIVVTTEMLRSLDPAEREALFAHERAHIAGRHHYFLAPPNSPRTATPACARPASLSASPRTAPPTKPPPLRSATGASRRVATRAIARAALA